MFAHGHSYMGNPLGCAAALAVLRIFEKGKILEGMRKTLHWFRNELQEFYEVPQVGDIRICGTLMGFEIVEDPESRKPYPPALRMGRRVVQEARRRGAILRALENVVMLTPPLAMSTAELGKLASITLESIRAAVASSGTSGS